MAIVLPRARLDLDSEAWRFLDLPEKSISRYQTLLDVSKLEQRLQDQYGQAVISLITTDIIPSEQALLLKTHPLDADIDMLVLVSKHAALMARLLLQEHIYKDASCFAVGSASKVFFEDVGVDIDIPVIESGKGLIGLDSFQNIKGKRILIVKGEEGLDEIESACRDRGAEVKVLDLYKRSASARIASQLENILQQLDQDSFIYGISVYSLKHLAESLKSKSGYEAVKRLPLKVMSDRIAKASVNMEYASISLEALDKSIETNS